MDAPADPVSPGSSPLAAHGEWVLWADVPDGVFSLGIEWDEATAAAEHAAFADRCAPLLESAGYDRGALIGQLASLRQVVTEAGLAYLGIFAAKNEDRIALILLSVAATTMEFPAGIDPASILAAGLRHEYPDAAVEEWETAAGMATGLRRADEATGLAQALVPFREASMLGAVTAYTYSPHDVDLATLMTALMANRLRVGHPESATPA